MKDSISIFNKKKEQAQLLMQSMQTYWPYGSPFPHTPGHQPVHNTNDLTSKIKIEPNFNSALNKNESARYSLAVFGEIIKEA